MNESFDEQPQHKAVTQLDLWRAEAEKSVRAKGNLRSMSDFELSVREELADAHGDEIETLIDELKEELAELMERLGPDEEIGVATQEDLDKRDELEDAITQLENAT